MSKRENGLAAKETTGYLKFNSTIDLLQQWSNALNSVFSPVEIVDDPQLEVNLTSLLNQQGNLYENIQSLILDEMIGRTGTRDKEQFIRMVQIMTAKLLNVTSSTHLKALSDIEYERLLNLKQSLLRVIHFIQEYFGNYFDKNEMVPEFLVDIYRKKISNLVKKLADETDWSSGVSTALSEMLIEQFTNEEIIAGKQYTYRLYYYENELLRQLLKNKLSTDSSIRSLLYFLNFNCSSFVIYEFDRLVDMITQLSTKSEKIKLLRTELKAINQMPMKTNYFYVEDMPSLKEQVSTWIEEEIKYCEAGHFLQPATGANTDLENKIHTTLSVAKLSLLVRLLVVDKIIINRTVAPMLRTVAKTFSTLQREEISFGSLETKYHAPDKATIAIMKEMLQKWIVLLGKL